MNKLNQNKLIAVLNLLNRHRGEAKGGYDEVAPIYDDFVRVWDHHIANPALAHYNRLIKQRVKPGAFILDAGAGTGEPHAGPAATQPSKENHCSRCFQRYVRCGPYQN